VSCTCSVAAPPWAQVLGLCPGLPQVQAQERGRVPCSHRIWSLAVLHGITGRRGYSGGEWVHLWGSFFFKPERGGGTKKKKGKCHSFLNTPNRTQGLFWHSNHALEKKISTLEGLLRPEVLASIGLILHCWPPSGLHFCFTAVLLPVLFNVLGVAPAA
jgi:hypothetical protein